MQDEEKLMIDLIKKQKDCEFSLRFFLQSKDGDWKNIFTMLKLVKKGIRSEVNFDYGDLVIRERLLSVEEGLKAVSNLYPKDDGKQKFAIPDYDEFAVQGTGKFRFVQSKHRYGFLRDDWPMRFREFQISQDKKSTGGDRELLREGLPYFPSVVDAVISFFELETEHFSSYGTVYIVIIDYRARIESLKLAFSKAELQLDSPEMEYKNLIVKVFAKSGPRILTLSDIYPKSKLVKFNVGFNPDNLTVALLSQEGNVKIDGKEFATWREEGEGVFLERPEEEIISLTRAGESQNLEYKYDVKDNDQKNDFIESVVAFLNTNSGVILVGISDDGNVVGSSKNAEDVHRMIHDSCEPPPRDTRIEEKEIAGKKVIVVDVPEGDEKPYQSKRDKNWYIRHNANDMRMERSELVRISQKLNQESSQYNM